MVNMLNRRAAITKAPEPGLLNGVLPAAPQGRLAMLHDYIDPAQNFIACGRVALQIIERIHSRGHRRRCGIHRVDDVEFRMPFPGQLERAVERSVALTR